MLGMAMNITIESLWKQGYNKSEISHMTGHDWKTIDKRIKLFESGCSVEKKPYPRHLDKYKSEILEFLEKDLSGKRIYEKLCGLGAATSYSTVKDFISRIKKREKICIRFHTEPGEEAQVDFGYVGLTKDTLGKKRKTWVFNMRLSYSRLDYYEKVYDQKVETFIRCHENAFRYFGGVTSSVKIDNLKAAVLVANFYEVEYQSLYKQFADYYGFRPFPCRVRKPQEKGKVESGIKYVKNNFFAGRSFVDGNDLDRQLKEWTKKVCNNRIHGTTRRIPLDVFNTEEKIKLHPLPEKDFTVPDVGQRKVYHDCHVYFDYNYYSVPFEYVGKNVSIEATETLVRILYNTATITVHPRNKDKGKFITDNSHYPPYKCHISTQYQESYLVKMKEIGPNAEQMFFCILDAYPTEWNRTVRGVLNLKRQFSPEIVDLACKRALAYGVKTYSTIRNICRSGAYNQPSEFNEEVYYAHN
jgi:transposase